jgi:MFS family permease
VLVVLLVIMIIQLAEQMITPVFALFATEKLGVQGMLIGCLYAAPGIMIFIMAPHWGKLVDKLTQKGMCLYHFISLILFVSAGLQFLHAFSESFAVIFTLRLLWGMCLGALLPLLLKILVEDTDQGARGVILGIGNSATKLGTVLGILLGALIESQYGYANSFLIMGILYVAAGLIMIRAQSLRVRVKALTTG